MRLSELAERVGGELCGDGDIEIHGVAGIREARQGDLTFLGNRRYEGYLTTTRASAVIVDDRDLHVPAAVIYNSNPYRAFQKAMTILYEGVSACPRGIHPTAVISSRTKLGADIAIGPHVVIEGGAVIGDRVVIRAGTYIGDEAVIGDDTLIYPNVVIRERVLVGCRNIIHAGAIIGDDGFGLAKDGARNHKIPQIGRVVLENDVEVGSNACIDRGTIGDTIVREGTRIDNLVQIGHNVDIGNNTVLCAQVGIAGSVKVGSEVVMAGQVGISGHLEIGDGVHIGAQAGVIGDIAPRQRVSGYPARPHAEQLRTLAASRRVPDLLKRIAELEARLQALENDGRRGNGAS